MKLLELPSTIILSYDLINVLSTKQRQPYLDRLNIHNYNFIAGPYFINNNHWLALIIDMTENHLLLLDPLLKRSTEVDSAMQSWIKYYESRLDHRTIEWSIKQVDHPIQTDSINCDVFVIRFIELYILHSKIHFQTTAESLEIDRSNIAKSIIYFNS